jgi:hypothetical protein
MKLRVTYQQIVPARQQLSSLERGKHISNGFLEVKGQGRLEERNNKNNETETESNIPADISGIVTASIVARASKGISN